MELFPETSAGVGVGAETGLRGGSGNSGGVWRLGRRVAAVVVGVGLLCASVGLLWWLGSLPAAPAMHIALAIAAGPFLLGLGLGVLLWPGGGVGGVGVEQEGWGLWMEPAGRAGSADGALSAAAGGESGESEMAKVGEGVGLEAAGGGIQLLLEEIRDLLLLSSEQRAVLGKSRLAGRCHALLTEARGSLEVGDWVGAGSALEHLRGMGYAMEEGEAAVLMSRNEELREASRVVEEPALAAQVEQLLGDGHAESAHSLARALVGRYPESGSARDLLSRTSAARSESAARERAGLYARLQEEVARRAWSAALASARELVGRFGGSFEAAAVEPKIATLEQNAGVAHRQELALRLREQLSVQDYVSAYRTALTLLRLYPESSQARSLLGQMAQLEWLSLQQQGRVMPGGGMPPEGRLSGGPAGY